MLAPQNFFSDREREIRTNGAAIQCLSRVHHSMAYTNFNVRSLCSNATFLRSSSGLPESISSSEECSAVITQAMTDSYSRSGGFAEAGVALGSLLWESELKMKKFQKALQGLSS